jgi:hypothetical protein
MRRRAVVAQLWCMDEEVFEMWEQLEEGHYRREIGGEVGQAKRT